MDQKKDNGVMQRNGHNDQKRYGFEYILRKSEKLTTALYLVSDIMSDREPMKWRLREAGVDLLSDVAVAATVSASERMTILRNVMKRVERIVSFLDITLAARMLSEMNVTVLRKEYLSFKDAVEAEWNRVHQSGKAFLGDAFFAVPMSTSTIDTQTQTSHQQQIAHSSSVTPQKQQKEMEQHSALNPNNTQGKDVERQMNSVSPTPPTSVSIAAHHNTTTHHQRVNPSAIPLEQKTQFVGHNASMPLGHHQEHPNASVIVRRENNNADANRSDRRKIILALVKQKPAINVGDVARSIPGVSEKTIQRELLAMVAEGILQKRGERRWSTYSLRS